MFRLKEKHVELDYPGDFAKLTADAMEWARKLPPEIEYLSPSVKAWVDVKTGRYWDGHQWRVMTGTIGK